MANSRNVCVVVLGDIGRSPRIQYHSKSLAEHDAKVDIICYKESRPLDALEKHTQVSFHYLVPYPNLSLPRILNYILKTLWQAITLMCVLFIIRKPDIMLVQNPPAIPTVFICWLFCTIMRVKYVIDWHNYAFTIMALNVGKNHVLTKMTRAVEMFAGKRAAYNFCVTKEMKTDLKNNYDICATTLYDRPAEIYKPITIEQKHHLLQRLSQTYNAFRGTDTESTMLTKIDEEDIVLRADRPGLIISSTSWTEDEDFSMLLTSLQEYERHIEDGNKRKLPKLICVITVCSDYNALVRTGRLSIIIGFC
ncbi:Glycosyltransferase Family 4 [Popillia japonica]|uniref:Glycosyltransferase Family 4 n=1 Tax=Popillia japonica TaxID=7064 RepID=A0AAW1IZ22_POPJA